MVKYPKIQTLFKRQMKGKKPGRIIEGDYTDATFPYVRAYDVYEKIDGTNIRAMIGPLHDLHDPPISDMDHMDPQLWFMGRTDTSEIPKHLQEYLTETYTLDKVLHAVRKARGAQGVILYMEGYGEKIQGGHNYRKGVSARIFDIFVLDLNGPAPYSQDGSQSAAGWWLSRKAIQAVARDLDVDTPPFIGRMTIDQIIEYVKSSPTSIVAEEDGGNPDYLMEGVVCKSNPMIYNRKGERVIWKLKRRDFIE